MTPFEQFLEDNSLRKKDVAEYLGIAQSNLSYYCSGRKIPKATIDKLSKNKKWDCSAILVPSSVASGGDNELMLATVEAMKEEIKTLRQMVESQALLIAAVKTITDILMCSAPETKAKTKTANGKRK